MAFFVNLLTLLLLDWLKYENFISFQFFILLSHSIAINEFRMKEVESIYYSSHIASTYNFSSFFSALLLSHIFILIHGSDYPFFKVPKTNFYLLTAIIHYFLLQMLIKIAVKQQAMHHASVCFSLVWSWEKKSDFKDMIFIASIQNDHW